MAEWDVAEEQPAPAATPAAAWEVAEEPKPAAAPEAKKEGRTLTESLTLPVIDIPREAWETTKEQATSAYEDITRSLHKPPEGIMGRLGQQWDVGKAIFKTATLPMAPIAGAIGSLVGHPLGYAYEKLGMSPEKAYETAKEDVGTASLAVRPAGGPKAMPRGPAPEAPIVEPVATPRAAEEPRAAPAETPPTSEPPAQPPPVPEPPAPRNYPEFLKKTMEKTADVWDDLQMKVAPMAAKSTAEARAEVKDAANAVRFARWDWNRVDSDLVKNFTPEQLTKMWEAADAESVALQAGKPMEGIGLSTLTPEERIATLKMQLAAQETFAQAEALGMVKGEGLPSYVPRMMARMTENAEYAPQYRGQAPGGLDPIGTNVKTATAQLRGRKHLTAEETEAAGKAALGDQAELVRNIRTLPLATARLREAVSWRSLVNKIKELGKESGQETVREGSFPVGEEKNWFTLDHPSFKTWKPRLETDPVTGKTKAVLKENGEPVFDQVPIYVRGDFEGPLRSVLTSKPGEVYKKLMDLKGKAMSAIMYSPIIHNAVEWGRALPAMPGKVASLKIYFEGNKAKNDPVMMKEAIGAGLDPIGRRYFNQDLSAIAEEPNLTTRGSWTGKILSETFGQLPQKGKTRAEVKESVLKDIDKAGDFWHNTLLWDRVGDLQMGLYKNIRDDLITRKGLQPETAQKVAAHVANRYAGALPIESMSEISRKIANLTLFSRSFTLGNLGAMKDMLVGLPKDVKAQILRDAGPLELDKATSIGKRKAISIIAMDIALMYAGNSILQDTVDRLRGDKTLGEIGQGYVDRLKHLISRVKEHPLQALMNPFSTIEELSSTSENEPGKKDRIFVGYTKDGTAIYARNPAGKIGEEFLGWLKMMGGDPGILTRKLGTIARPTLQWLSNDQGFGRKVIDPYDETPAATVKNIGRVVGLYMTSQLPTQSIVAAKDLITGEGDPKLNALQMLGPLAGITFSRGAPGGPAMGELYRGEEKHRLEVQREMPAIRRRIQADDIDGAREDMSKIGIPPGMQNWYIKTTQNPAARMSQRKVKDFMIYSTDEQKQRFERSLQRMQRETAP